MTSDTPMQTENLEHTDKFGGFCTQAKITEDPEALCEIIRQALDHTEIYVYGELMAVNTVQKLKELNNIKVAKHLNTLNLFAYGTYKQYQQNPNEFIQLTPGMIRKLQHLTIVSLAINSKSIPYSVLQDELKIDNVRHLEDLIIEAIYADIIHGKLFQNIRVFEIDYTMGRDVPLDSLDKIAKTLEEWSASCESVSKCIAAQIHMANNEKLKRITNKERIDRELVNLKKAIKTIADSDEAMQVDARDQNHANMELRKKYPKARITGRPILGKNNPATHNLTSSLGGPSSSGASTSAAAASGSGSKPNA